MGNTIGGMIAGGVYSGKGSLVAYVVFLISTIHTSLAQEWTLQTLSMPQGSNGDTNGVILTDLNYDGAIDMIFCGSSSAATQEQPYALMNLGYREGTFQFSDPLPIGSRGIYSTCDVQWLPQHDSVGVLLAGGASNPNQPTVVLTVDVQDCVFVDPGDCILMWSQIWQDTSPEGDIDAAFLFLGDEENPAIVLSSKTTVSVYESSSGVYSSTPTFTMPAEANEQFTTLSAGIIRRNPGFIAGSVSQTSGTLKAVYKTVEQTYVQENLGSAPMVSDIDVVSIRRGQQLVIPTNSRSTSLNPSIQEYFLIGNTVERYEIFQSDEEVVTSSMGMMFEDSTLPDAIFGMGNGRAKLFRNEGVDPTTSQFRGFSEDSTHVLPSPCHINDIVAGPIWPCTASIVVATRDCPSPGNYMFTIDTCDFSEFLEGLGSPSSPSSPYSPSSPSSPIFIAPRPSSQPSSSPTEKLIPSNSPSLAPESSSPSISPSYVIGSGNEISNEGNPSGQPTITLSQNPTSNPTISQRPTSTPTHSKFPSTSPTFSNKPSTVPTTTIHPSANPTMTTSPSSKPTLSMHPSISPTFSKQPSEIPTLSMNPSSGPTASSSPSMAPTTLEDHIFRTRDQWEVPSRDSGFSEYSMIIIICGAILVIVLLIALGVARWYRLKMKKARILKEHEDGYKSSSTNNSGSGDDSRCEERDAPVRKSSTVRNENASHSSSSHHSSESDGPSVYIDYEMSDEDSTDGELVCISFEDEMISSQ